MEFLDYPDIKPLLKSQGVVERADGDRMRFVLTETAGVAPEPTRIFFGPSSAEAPEGARRVATSRQDLHRAIDAVVHRAHLQEIVIIPTSSWRPILDIALFDLATDELWLQIDAEASLHQNSRDPLALDAREFDLLSAIAKAFLAHADKPDQEFHVVATGAPLLMSVSHEGSLTVWCGSAAFADELAHAPDAAH